MREKKCFNTLLDYLGHASVRLTTSKGTVIYIDPYAGKDYDVPADIILVTHNHSDHNRTDLVTKKDGCVVITPDKATLQGKYQSFEISDVRIEAVAAYNSHHKKESSYGYILEFDGIKLYHAGDTSQIKEMEGLADKKLTYALLPMDGVYNMKPEEAVRAAKMIAAKHVIPIHTGPNGVYSKGNVSKFTVESKLILMPGESIELQK